jgi:valyl-tRNA synthetase
MASVAADTAVVSDKEKELLAKLETSKAAEIAAKQAYSDAEAAGADAAALKKLQKAVKKAQKGVSSAEKGLKKLKKKGFNPAGTNQKKNKKKKAPKENVAFVNKTPKGEKKDVSGPMGDYSPQAVEAAWGEWWEAKGFYVADAEKAATLSHDEKFVIVIPPPNVTGSLHLGHALTCSIEDTIVRYQRMRGKTVLWLPGTDHAGIATQTVVEKKLMREEKKTRHDLGREAFLKKVWEWKEKNGNHITKQLRRLGTSVDWSREVFTMDANLSVAVNEAFVRMYEKGVIFRASRLVNWSSFLNTAISDIEVDYIDIEKPTMLNVPGHDKNKKYEFGTLTSFAYKVEGSDDEMVVATTRLETMLGDTAVACHPDDDRYKHLHGKFLIHPFRKETDKYYRIPVITDAELVDMSFGTGCVKITPAHDPNDFECGRRHGLDEITVFDDNGAINGMGGDRFTGMMRFDARIAIEEAMKELGLYKGKEPNKMRLGLCSRSKDIIEPLVKPQWWVKMTEMGDDAIECVKNGDLELKPAFHNKTWYRWLTDCRDWCISRQLWWGHRIPAYLVSKKGEAIADPIAYSNNSKNWVVARTKEEAMAKAVEAWKVPEDELELSQDPDVLDTWFSSGLFPFSTMGWPNEDSSDLKGFFPGHLLETGMDILFFWVARMVMMSRALTGKLPFDKVYLHAMVRDRYGRKMSKSLGNVIDPLEVINGATLEELHEKLRSGNLPEKEVKKAIEGQKMEYPEGMPECGADGLRFGLLSYTVQGRDVNLDVNRVFGYRKFCNKLWNMYKFADGMGSLSTFKPSADIDEGILSMALSERDRWILSRCATAAKKTGKNIEDYQFGAACNVIYDFFLKELCNVYLELVKPVLRGEDGPQKLAARATLFLCIDVGLRLAHPVMPFITEELFQRLPKREGDTTETISLAKFPDAENSSMKNWINVEQEGKLSTVLGVVEAFLGLRGDYLTGQYSNKRPEAFYTCSNQDAATVAAQSDDIMTLGKLTSLNKLEDGASAPAGCCAKAVGGNMQVFVQLKGLVDFSKEITKLEKETRKVKQAMAAIDKKKNAPGYDSAPIEVHTRNDEKYAELAGKLKLVEDSIATFSELAQ